MWAFITVMFTRLFDAALTNVSIVHGQLGQVLANQEKIMAKLEDFQTQLSRVDAATNKIAEDLQKLKDQIAGSGMDAETEASVLAQLDAAATKLEGIGKPADTPTDPTEPTEPTEPPVEG